MGVRHSKQADHSDDPLDFGSLVPLNTDTTATWDYDTKVVKRLIKEGRLAPFYQGKERNTLAAPTCINLTIYYRLLRQTGHSEWKSGRSTYFSVSWSSSANHFGCQKKWKQHAGHGCGAYGTFTGKTYSGKRPTIRSLQGLCGVPYLLLGKLLFYYYKGQPLLTVYIFCVIVLPSFYQPYSVLWQADMYWMFLTTETVGRSTLPGYPLSILYATSSWRHSYTSALESPLCKLLWSSLWLCARSIYGETQTTVHLWSGCGTCR
jgi:hypothetical protein